MAQVLNYHDAVMYETDLELFGDGGWLNDNCINWFFRVLEYDVFPGRTELLFMDPAVVACMMNQCDDPEEFVDLGKGLELETRSMVFVPVNNASNRLSRGSHWSLLVVEGESKRGGLRGISSVSGTSFRHFDSSDGSNRTSAERTAAKFSRMLDDAGNKSFVVDHVRGSPQQTNSFDCGMYTVLMAEALASKTASALTAPAVGQSGAATPPRSSGVLRTKENKRLRQDEADSSDRRGDGGGGGRGIAGESSSREEACTSGMVMLSPEFVSNSRSLARERLERCLRNQR